VLFGERVAVPSVGGSWGGGDLSNRFEMEYQDERSWDGTGLWDPFPLHKTAPFLGRALLFAFEKRQKKASPNHGCITPESE
jgi:hypothetical protein